MMRWIMVVVLTACELPEAKQPEEEQYIPPPKVAAIPPPPDVPPPVVQDLAPVIRDCPLCDEKKARREAVLVELEVAREKTAQRKCTSQVTQTVRPGVTEDQDRYVSRPKMAYLCDGKIVDSLTTHTSSILSAELYMLNRWIKEWCNRGPRRRIESPCPED